jgi:hypothetical protein
MHRRKNVDVIPHENQRQGYYKNDGNVDGDDILNCLFQIFINAPAQRNGLRHVKQIIIHQHQRGRILCHFTTTFTHGNTDVCSFKRGPSLTPSPVMATTSPLAFKCLNHFEFCSRIHAGENSSSPVHLPA